MIVSIYRRSSSCSFKSRNELKTAVDISKRDLCWDSQLPIQSPVLLKITRNKQPLRWWSALESLPVPEITVGLPTSVSSIHISFTMLVKSNTNTVKRSNGPTEITLKRWAEGYCDITHKRCFIYNKALNLHFVNIASLVIQVQGNDTSREPCLHEIPQTALMRSHMFTFTQHNTTWR